MMPPSNPSQRNSRRRFLKASSSSALALGASVLPQHALAAEADLAKSDSDFWNGKTLDNWHKPPKKIGHGTGGTWHLDPDTGILTGEQDPPGSGNGGLLLSDAQFSDFELDIEMRPDWEPCSGVFFRCNDLGHGFQET